MTPIQERRALRILRALKAEDYPCDVLVLGPRNEIVVSCDGLVEEFETIESLAFAVSQRADQAGASSIASAFAHSAILRAW